MHRNASAQPYHTAGNIYTQPGTMGWHQPKSREMQPCQQGASLRGVVILH